MTSQILNNSMVINTNNSEVDEISDKALKMIIRMVNEIKENMNKFLNEL
jgi:hypothetical protein